LNTHFIYLNILADILICVGVLLAVSAICLNWKWWAEFFWSLKYRLKSFKVTQDSLDNLKLNGVSDDIITNLDTLKDQKYNYQGFLKKLNTAIGSDMDEHKWEILEHTVAINESEPKPGPDPIPDPPPDPTPIPGRLPLLPKNKIGKFSINSSSLILPIHDGYDNTGIGELARKIAQNIYIACCQQGKVKDGPDGLLDPDEDPGEKISENQLRRHNWIRLFLHSSKEAELSDRIHDTIADYIRDTFENAPSHIDISVASAYSPKVQIFYDDSLVRGENAFRLELLPYPSHLSNNPLECPGHIYINVKTNDGKVNIPGCDGIPIRVGNQNFKANGTVPLHKTLDNTITIGAEAWCHIQTHPKILNGILTLGWEAPDEVGINGRIVRVSYTGRSELYIKADGKMIPFNKDRIYYDFPENKDHPVTVRQIIQKQENRENRVVSVSFANQSPVFDDLPGCNRFSDVDLIDSIFQSKETFAKFVATQIYMATKQAETGAVFLDDPVGKQVFKDPQNDKLKNEEVRCFVRMGLSPPNSQKIHEKMFGTINSGQAIATKILEIIDDSGPPPYAQAFEDFVKKLKLETGAGKEGIIVSIFEDIQIPNDTILLRAIPLIEPEERGKIYGEIDLSGWPGIADKTRTSWDPQKAFFIEYPKGAVSMCISRYPLYGLCAGEVVGAVSIQLIVNDNIISRLFIRNQSSNPVWIDGKEISPHSEYENDFSIEVSSLRKSKGFRSLILSTTDKKRELVVKIYDKPEEQQNVNEFISRPGKVSLYGITLGKRVETIGWKKTQFEDLWKDSGIDEDDLGGVSLVTPNGYLAVLEQGAENEMHYFAGEKTSIKFEGDEITLEKGQSTLSLSPQRPFPGSPVQIREDKQISDKIFYLRRELKDANNAGLLNRDFEEVAERYFLDEFEQEFLKSGEIYLSFDLLRCDPRDIYNLEKHLYYALTELNGGIRAWLFRKDGGIRSVRPDGGDKLNHLIYERDIVGPITTETEGKFFLVNWEGEEKTQFSTQTESHQAQIEKYLSSGYFSLEKREYYHPGGVLSIPKAEFPGTEECYISTDMFEFKDKDMAFNPREYCIFFDKDSFRIYYDLDKRRYVIEARHHPKGGVSPKTVFIIYPKGGKPILGSHATPPVRLEPGKECLILLPGLTFEFRHGTNYYIV